MGRKSSRLWLALSSCKGVPRHSILVAVLLSVCWASSGQAAIVPKDSDERIELLFWNSVEQSKNAADYEAYLEAYPKGRFAALARARAKYLSKGTVAAKDATGAVAGETTADPPAAKAAVTTPTQANTPAPPPSPPPVSSMSTELVTASAANVRDAPNTTAPVTSRLSAGATVQVTGLTADKQWYRIRLAADGTGFIHSSLLREPNTPPVSAPVSAPTPVAAVPATAPPTVEQPSTTGVASKTSAPSGEIIRDCDECPQMIRLAAGQFVMGTTGGDASERPAHKVTLAKAFAIGRYEVSLGEWAACVTAKACAYDGKKASSDPRQPIRNVSWLDAQQYVAWLSKRAGQAYRLPTEAEWEYAARAGTTTEFWWGPNASSGKANCNDCGAPYDRKAPLAVDALPPNAFGLYGTAGGVWEWTEDCWFRSHEGAGADAQARLTAGCRQRVLRGGSWRNDATYARSVSRLGYDADVRYSANGFRVARNLP